MVVGRSEIFDYSERFPEGDICVRVGQDDHAGVLVLDWGSTASCSGGCGAVGSIFCIWFDEFELERERKLFQKNGNLLRIGTLEVPVSQGWL